MPSWSIEPYDEDELDELIAMWRASFEAALGIADPHSIREQKQYFLEQVLPTQRVRVVHHDGRVVAFLAATSESVSQLYVDVGFQGRGIGSQLLNTAKKESRGSLWLYTFARNQAACGFYQRHGFRETARGFEETWQLEDLRYEWSRSEESRPSSRRTSGE